MNEFRNWRQNLPGEDTYAEAARLLGVSKKHVYRYEDGTRRVAPERVLEFEKITGISRHILRPDVYGPLSIAS
jgi:DNA-binding transcriptional regulator YdaS (Cro superfamily)